MELGVAVGVASLINSVASITGTLSTFKERFGHAALNITIAASQLTTLKAALEAIHRWRSRATKDGARSEQLDRDLVLSLESCALLVAVIERKLAETNLENPSVLDRLRFVRLDAVFKDFTLNLDAQVRALNLLLTIHQCATTTEQSERLQRSDTRKVFREIQETVDSLSQEGVVLNDAASILSEDPSVSFDVDPILLQSPLYRKYHERRYLKMVRESGAATKSSKSPTTQKRGHKKTISSESRPPYDEPYIAENPALPFLGVPYQGEFKSGDTESDVSSNSTIKGEVEDEAISIEAKKHELVQNLDPRGTLTAAREDLSEGEASEKNPRELIIEENDEQLRLVAEDVASPSSSSSTKKEDNVTASDSASPISATPSTRQLRSSSVGSRKEEVATQRSPLVVAAASAAAEKRDRESVPSSQGQIEIQEPSTSRPLHTTPADLQEVAFKAANDVPYPKQQTSEQVDRRRASPTRPSTFPDYLGVDSPALKSPSSEPSLQRRMAEGTSRSASYRAGIKSWNPADTSFSQVVEQLSMGDSPSTISSQSQDTRESTISVTRAIENIDSSSPQTENLTPVSPTKRDQKPLQRLELDLGSDASDFSINFGPDFDLDIRRSVFSPLPSEVVNERPQETINSKFEAPPKLIDSEDELLPISIQDITTEKIHTSPEENPQVVATTPPPQKISKELSSSPHRFMFVNANGEAEIIQSDNISAPPLPPRPRSASRKSTPLQESSIGNRPLSASSISRIQYVPPPPLRPAPTTPDGVQSKIAQYRAPSKNLPLASEKQSSSPATAKPDVPPEDRTNLGRPSSESSRNQDGLLHGPSSDHYETTERRHVDFGTSDHAATSSSQAELPRGTGSSPKVSEAVNKVQRPAQRSSPRASASSISITDSEGGSFARTYQTQATSLGSSLPKSAPTPSQPPARPHTPLQPMQPALSQNAQTESTETSKKGVSEFFGPQASSHSELVTDALAARQNEMVLKKSRSRWFPTFGGSDKLENMRTICRCAAVGEDELLLRHLKNLGSSVDIHTFVTLKINEIPKTAFMWAASGGHPKCMQILANFHADVLMADRLGRTALHLALEAGQVESVNWIVDHIKRQPILPSSLPPRDLINLPDKVGTTPVHLAAQLSDSVPLLILIESGGKTDSRNNLGQTPAYHSIKAKKTANLRLLLEHGVPIEAPCAINEAALIVAVKMNTPGTVQLLLDKGASKRQKDANGWYPIHHAASLGHLQILEMLFTSLDDLEAKNDIGERPLHLAVRENRFSVVQALLQANCKVDAWTEPPHARLTDKSGPEKAIQTGVAMKPSSHPSLKLACLPLHYACLFGLYDVTRALLDAGSSRNSNQEDGTSALMLACEAKSPQVVQLLLERGANPNTATSGHCITALHVACARKDRESCKVLVSFGADVRARMTNSNGDTPTSYAQRRTGGQNLATNYLLYHARIIGGSSLAHTYPPSSPTATTASANSNQSITSAPSSYYHRPPGSEEAGLPTYSESQAETQSRAARGFRAGIH